MKLLLVYNSTANYVDVPAIQQILNYVGTPYDMWDVTTGTAPTLSDGSCHGYYQGVIFAYGDDYASVTPPFVPSPPAWVSALIDYEVTFNVRQLNWNAVPRPQFGLSSGTQLLPYNATTNPGGYQTYTANFQQPAAASVFFYANTNTPVTITNATIDLASATAGVPGTLTPLLQDAQGNILSATYELGGQQFLTQTFDSNQFLMHDLVLAYGLLNWVTKGVFLGDYHVYATQEVDDFFINDSEWVPSTPCSSTGGPIVVPTDRTAVDAANLPVFRVDSDDMGKLATWQTGIQDDPSGLFKGFELTMAFNGVGTAGNGDWTGLTAPITSAQATGGVATFTTQSGFSALPGQQVVVTGTNNGLDGTYTIPPNGVTSLAGQTPGAPAVTSFTVNILSTATIPKANQTNATASVTDDLVANLGTYQGAFHWISHTYNHPTTLNGLCQTTPTGTGCGDVNNGNNPTDDIELEILTNLWVASSPCGSVAVLPCTPADMDSDQSDTGLKPLTFTDFNPGNIVTPGVTGLNDPNVPIYLYDYGISYAVSDTSVTNQPNNGPNPSPNVGIVNSYAPGIYEVPRHPNDIFYNVANWADNQAEFVCIYTYYTPPNTAVVEKVIPYSGYNASQILDYTSNIFVTNMLMGDMDPEMFHQPDLHFSDNSAALLAAGPPDSNISPPNPGTPFPPVPIPGVVSGTVHTSSLLSDTYDFTFYKYKQLYNLPVLTPTLDAIGVLMKNRNSFNVSGVTGSIVNANTANAQLTLTVPASTTNPPAVIPVTGLSNQGAPASCAACSYSYESYGGQNISHITIPPGTPTVTYSVSYPQQ
ncbi:MAG TPA: hypothetical protein VEI01_17140 [Terriglobales bacterium]|nr:hypothetical protein [Terriglobales bacterium]